MPPRGNPRRRTRLFPPAGSSGEGARGHPRVGAGTGRQAVTYLQFHLIFILPPILLLGWGIRGVFPALGRRAPVALPLIVLAAFVYTTPWDNYLVWKEVWGYPPERVLGRIGYVPVEEYLFFGLQPVLVGLLFYRLLARLSPRATGGGADIGADRAPSPNPSRSTIRLLGALPWMLLTVLGARLLTFEAGTYMGLILAWAAPVVALQWLYMGPEIWRLRRAVLPAIALPTLYLWVADRIAIGNGIWYISERFTLGWNPLGLPLEEATFFLITNVLVVFGTALFLAPGLPHLREAPSAPPPGVRASPATRAALLALLALGSASGCGPGTDRLPGGGSTEVDADSRILLPGVRAGPVTPETTELELVRALGAHAVRPAEVPVGEGFCFPGTVLFPETPDEAWLTWEDPARTHPAVLRLERPEGSWRTPEGVGVGLSLDDLVALNGRPIGFLGFGWDYGGRVTDWSGGQLAPVEVEGRPGLVVILDAPASAPEAEGPGGTLPPEVLGELSVRSDRPGLRGLGIHVVAVEVALGSEPAEALPCQGPDGIGSGPGASPGGAPPPGERETRSGA